MGDAHRKGYATEIASAAMSFAEHDLDLPAVIATVDIPNTGSVKVIEKLGFDFESQISAYGSDDMYLYRKTF